MMCICEKMQIVADDQAGYRSNRYISPENPPDPGYIPS